MAFTHFIRDSDVEDLQRMLPERPTPRPAARVSRCWWGEPECSLGDVAAELGVTRERARQIERAALQKLYKNCVAAGLSSDDLVG